MAHYMAYLKPFIATGKKLRHASMRHSVRPGMQTRHVLCRVPTAREVAAFCASSACSPWTTQQMLTGRQVGSRR